MSKLHVWLVGVSEYVMLIVVEIGTISVSTPTPTAEVGITSEVCYEMRRLNFVCCQQYVEYVCRRDTNMLKTYVDDTTAETQESDSIISTESLSY